MKKTLLLTIIASLYAALSAHATTYFDTRALFTTPSTPAQDLVAVNPQGAFDYIRVGTLSQSISATDLYITFSVPTSNSCAKLNGFGSGIFGIAVFPSNFFLQSFTDASLQTPLAGNSMDASFGIRALPDGTCVTKFDNITLPSGSYIVLAFGLLPQFSDRLNPWPLTVTAGGTWESVPPFCSGGAGINSCVVYSGTPYILITDVNPFPDPPAHGTTYLDTRNLFVAPSTPTQDLNLVNPTDGGVPQDSSINLGTILADIPGQSDYYLNFSAPFPNACATIVNNLQPSGTSFFNIAYFTSDGEDFSGHDDVAGNDIQTLPDGTCVAHFRALTVRNAGSLSVLQVRHFFGGYLIPSFPLVMTSGGTWTGPLAPYCGLHCRHYNGTLYAQLSDNPSISPTPQTGTITVITNNIAATFTISDGNGNNFQGSGGSFSQAAPPGTYTIRYADVPGFITPPSTTASLSAGGTINFSGTYIALPQPLGSTGPTNQQQFVAEPVSSGTGNYYYQHTDFSIPGRGKSLVFQRTYNTLDNYSGPLGANWTHTYNVALTQTQATVTIKWDDGHSEIFIPNGSKYLPQLGVFSVLIKNGDGSFTLTKKDQTRYGFAVTGKLSGITDRNGNTTNLIYDILGNLIQVTDAGGRSLIFLYDSSTRIIQITDPAGRTQFFQYDSGNNLVGMIDPAGGNTTWTYDVNHRVLLITLPNGQTLLQNSYDGGGRVVSQTNGLGRTWTFAYGTPTPGDTTITDARGNKTVHTYDSLLRIVKITDSAGGVTSFGYDSNNNRASVTNQNGNTTSFAYDAQGNVTGITDPIGSVVGFTYDSRNNLLTATNAKGKTTAFVYDDFSNLVSIKDALGGTTAFAYNSFGQMISKTDARGNVTGFTYDPSGNLTKIVNALGNVTTLSYDGIGRLTALTDPNGHVASAAYDSLSRLIKVSDPLGNQTQFAYDAVSNLVKVTDAKGNATSYAYDAINNLATVTDALQHVTQYAYDPNNNRMKFTNAKGNETSYTFDALNRLNSVTDPLGFVTAYQYDFMGNVIQTTDAKGQTNKFSYDALNRLIGIAYADGKTVAYTFDVNGNRTSMVDMHGTTTYAYDALDRLTAVTHPGGKLVGYAYDAVGNRSTLTYPDGKVTGYSYDSTNRLFHATDWLGRSTGYSYDPAGNLTRTAYPNGASIVFSYDAANRLNKIVNAAALGAPMVMLGYTLDPVGNRTGMNINGLPIAFGYDALNELTSTQLGLLKTSWTYDAVGNRLKEISPTGAINYTYDAADRLLQAGTRLFTYDANGNETSATASLPGTPVVYQYDAANRLIAASGYKPSTFVYDGDGNRVAQSVGSGSYSYINDVMASLPVVLQEAGPDGPITYEYGLGLIEAFSPEFNFFYHYDGLGSIIALTNAAGKPAAAYAYDPWGNTLLDIPDNVDTKNKFRFSGEAFDPGTQLYYLRARYYDANTGRLLTKDTFAGLAEIPQTLNPYTYALNRPTVLTDRSGHFAWLVPGIAGALVNDGFYTFDVLFRKEQFSWSVLAGRTTGGFVAPYAFIGCTSVAGPVAGGACAGASEYVADTLITQKVVSNGDAIITGNNDPRFATENFSWANLTGQTALSALLGPLSESLSGLIGSSAGRNPTTFRSFLTGRETQTAVFREFLDRVIDRAFNNLVTPTPASAMNSSGK